MTARAPSGMQSGALMQRLLLSSLAVGPTRREKPSSQLHAVLQAPRFCGRGLQDLEIATLALPEPQPGASLGARRENAEL
jgi:hypothetical protein